MINLPKLRVKVGILYHIIEDHEPDIDNFINSIFFHCVDIERAVNASCRLRWNNKGILTLCKNAVKNLLVKLTKDVRK